MKLVGVVGPGRPPPVLNTTLHTCTRYTVRDLKSLNAFQIFVCSKESTPYLQVPNLLLRACQKILGLLERATKPDSLLLNSRAVL